MIAVYHSYISLVKLLVLSGAHLESTDCFGKRAIDRAKNADIFNVLQAASLEQRLLGTVIEAPH